MSTEFKRSSLQRYARVNEILLGDNLLKTKISKRMIPVFRPDQSQKDFPAEIIYVTDEIHKQGLDAYTASKLDIIKNAIRLLVQVTPPALDSIVPAGSVPPPGPEAAPRSVTPAPAPADGAPATNGAQKRRGRPPVAEKSKKASATPPVEQVAAPATRRKPAVAKTTPAEKKEEAPAPAATEAKTVAGNGASKTTVFIRPHVPYVVGVALAALLQSCLVLIEAHETTNPDLKAISKRVNDLIDDIHARTVISNAEKEDNR